MNVDEILLIQLKSMYFASGQELFNYRLKPISMIWYPIFPFIKGPFAIYTVSLSSYIQSSNNDNNESSQSGGRDKLMIAYILGRNVMGAIVRR